MNKLNIISLNANGLHADVRRQKTLMWCRQQKANIILLQETHTIAKDESKWRDDWEGDIYMAHGVSNSKGVAILIAPNVNYDLLGEFSDSEGRIVIIEICINETKLLICNSYGYNEDKAEFFDQVIETIEGFDFQSLIWGGDHNVVLNLDLDKDGGLYRTHEACKNKINAWIEENNVDDVWRLQHPTLRRYTWRSKKKPLIQTRLDFFLTSSNISAKVVKSNILPGFSSDHSAPQIIVDISNGKGGKGFWKLNVELLKEEEYRNKVISCIQETKLDNPNCDETLLWDTIKCRVRGISVKYASARKHRMENEFKILEKCLVKARENLDIYPPEIFPHIHRVMNTKITKLESKINEHITRITEGHVVRSRTRFYEEGEKNSKYFLGLEKRRGDTKSIKHLIKGDGTHIYDNKDILLEEKEFYVKLYSTHRTQFPDYSAKKEEFVANLNIPQLNKDEANETSGIITEDELNQAIHLSADNKSPGTDGLGNEFYKIFWPYIKHDLLAAINNSFTTGSLSISQRQGIISLIPKAGKDPCYLKNWRPISLLNQDYKLIARILAERCKKHLQKLISDDQNGFVPNRYIGLNIHRILNLIEICKQEDINGLLLNIDFEKAFDCIEWDYIYTALQKFGFPEIFISYVKTLYQDISACVINTGNFTEFFKLYRGVRQGCPLSPYLFVLSAELLSLFIKQKSGIEGIVYKGSTYLISQFADDTSLSIMGTSDNLNKCFETLKQFEAVSGLKVNVNKTEAMGLGTFSDPICPHIKIKWVQATTRVLGIDIARDRDTLISENYANILDKISARLKGWQRRKLSMIGKINIIKCLGISQIIYLFTMLPSPGMEFLKKLENLLFHFIWDKGKDRIKRSTLIGPPDLGGVGMIDVHCLKESVNISWIKRLALQPGIWSTLITSQLNMDNSEDNIKYFLRANIKYTDIKLWVTTSPDNPWGDILLSWCKYNYKDKNRIIYREDILSQALWFNSSICIAGKPVFYLKWFNGGIHYVADLVIDRRWKTLKEIKSEYGLLPKLLEYLGVLNAIDIKWRRQIKSTEPLNLEDTYVYNIDKICNMKKVNKEVYRELCEHKCEPPTGRWHKWITELNLELNELDWLDCFPLLYNCTTSTKLRSLGYRFLIRDVLTNNRLFHMGKVDTILCYICKLEVETIPHLYWDCPNNKRLWERLKLYIMEKYNWELILDPTEMLMGVTTADHTISMPDVFNLLCLVTKNYIHSCKCNDKVPHENGLLNCIKQIKYIEYAIAQKRGLNAIRAHARKWYRCE